MSSTTDRQGSPEEAAEMPLVSVIFPVYNGEEYLKEAIESILNQTFSDFEFLIINDGSTDRSVEIIEAYNDPRIRLVHNETNLKLIATLNKGLDLARGEYIARMDSDDISRPERLQKQVAFMDANPDVGVCGSWFEVIPSGEVIERPVSNEEIKIHLFRDCAIAHPTAMMRTRIMRKHNLFYDPSFAHVEDYDLWTRMIRITKMHNIPEVLLRYRVHEWQVCNVHTGEQREVVNTIRLEQLSNLDISPSEREQIVHLSAVVGSIEAKIDPSEAREWVAKLTAANTQLDFYSEPAFSLMLHNCLSEFYKRNNLSAFLKRKAEVALKSLLLWKKKLWAKTATH